MCCRPPPVFVPCVSSICPFHVFVVPYQVRSFRVLVSRFSFHAVPCFRSILSSHVLFPFSVRCLRSASSFPVSVPCFWFHTSHMNRPMSSFLSSPPALSSVHFFVSRFPQYLRTMTSPHASRYTLSVPCAPYCLRWFSSIRASHVVLVPYCISMRPTFVFVPYYSSARPSFVFVPCYRSVIRLSGQTGDVLRIERDAGGPVPPTPGVETRSTIETDFSREDGGPSSSSINNRTGTRPPADAGGGTTCPWVIRVSSCQDDGSSSSTSSSSSSGSGGCGGDSGGGSGGGGEFNADDDCSSGGGDASAGSDEQAGQEQGMVLYNVASGGRLHVR